NDNWTPRRIFSEGGKEELVNIRKVGRHVYELSHADGRVEQIRGAGWFGRQSAEDALQEMMQKPSAVTQPEVVEKAVGTTTSPEVVPLVVKEISEIEAQVETSTGAVEPKVPAPEAGKTMLEAAVPVPKTVEVIPIEPVAPAETTHVFGEVMPASAPGHKASIFEKVDVKIEHPFMKGGYVVMKGDSVTRFVEEINKLTGDGVAQIPDDMSGWIKKEVEKYPSSKFVFTSLPNSWGYVDVYNESGKWLRSITTEGNIVNKI
ncbi:hypothetical protein IID27_03495, partial [Patescibacteria group bacterium]|nr:hypothetical protein [Patescibacteria group bacterium]